MPVIMSSRIMAALSQAQSEAPAGAIGSRSVSDPGSWKKMPSGDAPAHTPDYSYELTAEIDEEGFMEFSLTPGRGTAMPDDNQLMNMNVYEDCTIELTLSKDLSWYFPEDTAVMQSIMLADSTDTTVPPPEKRYSGLHRDTAPGKCSRVWFYAKRVTQNVTNYDHINIWIALDQKMADGTISPDPLYLLIDPGIKNPGDDPT